MTNLRWFFRLTMDIFRFGFVNQSYGLALSILALLCLGLVILGAQVSAPFIYTLF